jgi:nuclear pore complex protein Nup107
VADFLSFNIAEEDDILTYIRNTYFPDIILNYISALYYASLKISRGLLIRSMELVILISEDNFMLECFAKAKRMTELADVMALTSAAMVNSPPTKMKKNEGFGRLDLWNITLRKENEDEDSIMADRWP